MQSRMLYHKLIARERDPGSQFPQFGSWPRKPVAFLMNEVRNVPDPGRAFRKTPEYGENRHQVRRIRTVNIDPNELERTHEPDGVIRTLNFRTHRPENAQTFPVTLAIVDQIGNGNVRLCQCRGRKQERSRRVVAVHSEIVLWPKLLAMPDAETSISTTFNPDPRPFQDIDRNVDIWPGNQLPTNFQNCIRFRKRRGNQK